MRLMTARQLQETGLLWQANEAVFWPLGLMLSVRMDTEHPDKDTIFVQYLEPPDVVNSNATKEEQADKADRLRDFTIERMAEIERHLREPEAAP